MSLVEIVKQTQPNEVHNLTSQINQEKNYCLKISTFKCLHESILLRHLTANYYNHYV